MYERRLRRIFRKDGRTVIIALDHGLIDGPCEGFEDVASTLNAVVAGGADAILTSFGIAKKFVTELADVGLIVRSDGAETNLGTPSNGSVNRFFGPEDAIRIGADAMVVTAMPGCEKEAATLETLAHTVSEAHTWGLPILGEMVPGGFNGGPEVRGTDAIAIAARLGAELGAAFIKAPYGADYEKVTSSTFAPVVILGGTKGDEADMLSDIRNAINAGGKGVAIGRNVFQSDDPTAMTKAVVAIVHDDASVEEAMAIIGR